ncbi:stage V sporulation protein B [Thermosyntropha lipolytica DSM 11003]|uniref:Stage V sporulation protein B n=1 Tax=Thermosyntropha lipolytica DSM 11003 TaxID=1123382 RepID=A0A1M5JSL4_9FIRM|nr:polysaccharide biosynthesis protein [Thermosyntropha lipolytica]SHG43415.1 stage V sporulation protein B [Thermosyntropha lipolytica DSM 11003]
MEKKQTFLKGALILSIAGAISKLLGAIYRIPLARMIGAEGIGLYQMAYPIYTTILALATAGVPVAISIMVARKETEGYSGDSFKILKASLFILFIIGLLLTLMVIQGAGILADYVLKNPQAYYPILAVSPAIFLAGLMSVFRGFFQGHQSMVPTAVSQVVEQLFRVTAVLILAYFLVDKGIEYAAAGATFGAVIGGVAGLIVLIFYYIAFIRRHDIKYANLLYSGESTASLGRKMIKLAIPVSVGAVVLPLVQMLDAIIVPGRLIALNYTVSQATALYGHLSGMAAVLISLPTIFTISIATSMVPAISEAQARNDRRLLIERLNYGFRGGMLISFPAAAGLFVLAFPICDLLYGAAEAGAALEPLAFSAVVLAAFQISSAGLQGIGKPEIAMRHLVITGIFKVIFNYSLTSIPALNIKGAAIGTVLAFCLGSLLNLIYLKRYTGIRYETGRMLKILLVTVVMAITVKISYQYLVAYDVSSHLSTLLAITWGVIVYGILLLVVRELDIAMIRKIIKGA